MRPMIREWDCKYRVIVAADHGDQTLLRYLEGQPARLDSLSLVRRTLIRTALDGGADMVVAGQSDFHWTVENFSRKQALIGMPDVQGVSELSSLARALQHQPSPNVPFKIGFGLSLRDQTTGRALESFLQSFGHLAFVLEPYFAQEIGVDRRSAFLCEAREFGNVVAFKLDVSNARLFSRAYTEAAGPKPWFARSDGLDYDDFRERVSYSAAHGCFGVIAGAAVWRSELHNLRAWGSRVSAQDTIRTRISALRNVLDRGG